MVLLLLLVVAAIVLGVVGILVDGLFYLLIIGAVVLVAAIAYRTVRYRRSSRPGR